MTAFQDLQPRLRATKRLFFFILVLIYFFSRAALLYVSTSDSVKRRRRLINNTTHVGRLLMRSFNVTVVPINVPPEAENSLLVGNHIGFIDIVCLQSVVSSVFITSLDMKNTPVLGQITQLGGCTYVDRKSRISIQNELQDLVQTLKEGFKVVLYAESVASNGEQVLPFKKTLMTAAGKAAVPIRPFVFNFASVDGGRVKFEHRDSLCWYSDEGFAKILWRTLLLEKITVEIEFLPLVHVPEDEDRSHLAVRVHGMVSARFKPFYPSM